MSTPSDPEARTADTEEQIPWRLLLLSAFVPNMVFQIGQGAIIPVAPTFARSLGASLGLSAFLLVMLTGAQVVATVPAGRLISAIGESRSMMVSAVVSAAGATVCFVSQSVWVLAGGVALIGISAAVFSIARHAYLTVAAPFSHRARAISMSAGFARIGLLIGPFICFVIVRLTGLTRPVFLVVVAAAIAIGLLTHFAMTPNEVDPSKGAAPTGGVLRTMVRNRRALLTVGVAAAIISMMRTSRLILVPLWGAHLGLPVSTIALIVAISALPDVALFYFGGQLMDRYGRLWVAVPTLAVFALAHLLMAGLNLLQPAELWLVGISLVMAIANGLSSGINALLGSDLAPPGAPTIFLTGWRIVIDSGPAAAPLLLAIMIGVASLSAATATMGFVAVLGIGLVAPYRSRLRR